MVRRGYVQLANGFYLNRKVRRLRRTMPSAIGAYAIMLSYCGDNLTDGYVDADTAEFVHDYLEHNRSRQQVMAKRKRERERYSAESLPAESAQTAGRIETESGQTPEHQNTRTQKKEKEEYSSSFSKETTADEYLETGRLEADRQISRQYPNLDLTDAWGAFMQHHHGETRTINDWTCLWKGWGQRRANMSGIPQKTPHTHTWACEHTLKRLGIESRDDVQDMTKAQQTANQLNKEDRNGRT